MRSTNALALISVLALVVGSCGGSDTAATTSSSATTAPSITTTISTSTTTTEPTTTTTVFVPAEPGYGGEAIIGDDQEPPTLNPYAPGGDNFIVHKIGQAIYVGVYDAVAMSGSVSNP